jgi:hypothetical protein
MKFKRYHCEEFTLRFRTERKNFAQRKFFRDPRISEFSKEWQKGKPLKLTHFTNNSQVSDFHVHAELLLAGSSVRVSVRWVGTSFKKPSRALGFLWTPNCDENEWEITRRCL